MFLGSGAGSTAYCIIEQGRVDALLQASPHDRRAIFEEAAGISRFKAKKLEALRKLERTAENLTRLGDIVGEVESRLRRVRLDAEKARKFQEYNGRLKTLRLDLGLREFHTLTKQLADETSRLESLQSDMSAAQVQVAVWETEASEIDQSLTAADAEIAQTAEAASDAERQIATLKERQATKHPEPLKPKKNWRPLGGAPRNWRNWVMGWKCSSNAAERKSPRQKARPKFAVPEFRNWKQRPPTPKRN